MAFSYCMPSGYRHKAQAALEYTIVVGLALLILAPMTMKGWQSMGEFNRDTNFITAKNALDQIGDAAKIVYFQGPPSTMTIKVVFPDGIVFSDVSGHDAYFRVSSYGTTTDIASYFDFNVTGNITGGPGERTIYIEALPNYVVNITKMG